MTAPPGVLPKVTVTGTCTSPGCDWHAFTTETTARERARTHAGMYGHVVRMVTVTVEDITPEQP